MFSKLILLGTLFIAFAAQSQLISTTQKKVSKFSFDTNTYVYFNANILNSFRSLVPNEAHLNTPLGLRANENTLVCASYAI
tara:strand:- start:353 stop:595 length:243 start_codon:yes stop_codon:yes gene_type:complete